MRESAALVMTALALCGPAHGFSFRDDFAGYPAGSDASPTWETGSIGWEVAAGVYACEDGSKDFAIVGESPAGRRVLVEAGLTLRPGERRAEAEPVACVLAAVGRPWKELADGIESLREVSCRAFEAERR